MREKLWSETTESGFFDKLRLGKFDKEQFADVREYFKKFLVSVKGSELEDAFVADVLFALSDLRMYASTMEDDKTRSEVFDAYSELETLIEDELW